MEGEHKDTVTNYLTTLPDARRERGIAIHRLVKKLFPKAECDFSYRMPTYHVDKNFFAWKSQKAYLSIYTCSAERISSFTKQHSDIPYGVGCINFRDHDPFPLRDISTVIKNALAPSSTILKREQLAITTAKRNKG